MKKFMLSALCAFGLLAAGSSAQAQDTFSKGTNALNVGLGVPSSFTGMRFLPIGASYEHSILSGILDKGSVGVGADAELYMLAGGVSAFTAGRVSAHYEFIPKLDTYLGVSLGLGIHSGLGANFGARGHIGARYFFSEKLGGFAEIGSGWSVLRLGVSVNL